jgi:hypothetical protein
LSLNLGLVVAFFLPFLDGIVDVILGWTRYSAQTPYPDRAVV